jgi:hypothetical protein
MTTILKTVSAVAIAAATLTGAAVATSNIASAFPAGPVGHGPVGHGPVLPSAPYKLSPVINHFGPIKCLACNLPRPEPSPPQPVNTFPTWNHGHNWHDRPEIYVERTAGPAVFSAPLQVAPAYIAAPQAAAGSCNCLTKQNLPDGSVEFQDICAKVSAIASPQAVGAR